MFNKKTIRYIIVVIYPLLISIAMASAWAFLLYNNGIYFSPEAETPFLYMIIPLVGFVYVIFASLAVNSVFDKYKEVKRSVVRKDIGTYLEHREQQLPVLMRILVAIPSLILLFLALMYQYADFPAGVASVFLVTLVVSTTWIVINELDNIHERAYFKTKVPSHWRSQKAENHFKEK